MTTRTISTTVDVIDVPSHSWREAALSGDPIQHGRLYDEACCLHQIELGGASTSRTNRTGTRIIAWNAERLKFVEVSAERLRALDADIILLSEVDLGMARSGNRHTVRDLAAALGMTYAFGVEFIELEIGNAEERTKHAGETNRAGLHGGAILFRLPVQDVRLIRLEQDGFWFSGERKGERRVGGRIAITASVTIDGQRLWLAAPHLESHSSPAHRGEQMGQLLQALEAMTSGGPLIVGGDLNTKGVEEADWRDPASRVAAIAQDPDRLRNPTPYEPLFERAAEHALGWVQANPDATTQRYVENHQQAVDRNILARLDWFLTRGVAIKDASVEAAVDTQGNALSDHEILVIDLG